MRNSILISCALFLLVSQVFAGVVINGVEISDSGKIIYLDKTEQGTATLKGDEGPQGPKGDEGPQGQVNKDALCQIYSTEGVNLPAFCSKKLIFITSQRFDGNLGGLSGADAKCQSAATAGGLSGTFKAWLSDSTTNAKDRLTHNPAPYIRTDGAVIAHNWFDLTDGHLKEPILCDEFKGCDTYKELIGQWTLLVAITGTQVTGSMSSPYLTKCNDWTSSNSDSDQLEVGLSSSINYEWSQYPTGTRCNSLARLYCIEQ